MHVLAVNTHKFFIEGIHSSKVVGESQLEFGGLEAFATVIVTSGLWTVIYRYNKSHL